MATTVTWLSYEFHVLTHNADWSDAGGVYIFTGVNPTTNRWIPYYVGQTGSFRDRIPSHEKWSPAVLLGATHVHARVVSQEATRLQIERELIEAFHPPLNER